MLDMTWRRSFLVLSLAALLATLLPSPAAARRGDDGPPRSWSEKALRPVHRLLRKGEWEEASVKAGELVEQARGGNPFRYSLADALLMQAVADANLGRLRQAEVGLWTAHALGRQAFPALAGYGSGGRFLWDERPQCLGRRPDGEQAPDRCAAADPLADAAVSPPRPLDAAPLAGGPEDSDEHAVVRLLVDETGRVSEASLLAAGDWGIVPEVMTAVAGWRFEPARRGGEPVAAVYESAVPAEPRVQAVERDAGGVEGWRRRLAAAEASLAAGEHAAALAAAVALQEEMERRLAAGGSDLLAEALWLRALAEAELAAAGDGALAAAAAWHWQAAQNLAPQLRYRDLADRGEAAAALAAHTLSPAVLGEAASQDDDGPAVVERSDAVAGAAGGGVVEIGVAVGADGRPSRPVWSAGASPARVSAALEALRGWRFEPAAEEVRLPVVVQVADPATSLTLPVEVVRLTALAGSWIERDPVVAACMWSSAQSIEPRLSGVAPATLAGDAKTRAFVLEHLLAPPAYRSWSPYPASEIAQVGGDVQAPVKKRAPPPQYTPEAREKRVQGAVIVQSVIDEEGRIRRLRLLKGLPHGLSESTAATICRWRFAPATLDGETVAVYYNLTVNFSLE